MTLRLELSKFKVKSGKSAVVDEWMKFLNENMENVLLTLKDEKMYVETIFREKAGNEEYLYWYSIQGDGGSRVEESDHEVDKQHLQYWHACIDEDFAYVDMRPEISMIQETVLKTMK